MHYPQNGLTALHKATAKGDIAMVEFLMAQVNPDITAKDIVSWNL